MKQVAIYIKDLETLEYNRLDLFTDEKISINSSIQNINDISKTYTDFSQTFTIPGSVNNNKIFKHWYENSNDEGFSTLNKSDAYIEIDTVRFRTGKIQLESANVQDGDIKNYSITFIGSLGNLKDKFAGASLKDLHLENILAFTYNPTNVKNAILTATQSSVIMFPLISSINYWTYDTIGTAAKPIYYDELFPAVSLEAMFVALEYVFNINFIGDFLLSKKFINAFLWLKNAEKFEFKTAISPDFNLIEANGNPLATINLTTDAVTLKWTTVSGPGTLIDGTLYFNIEMQFSVANIPYNVIIYKDGKVLATIPKITTTTSQTYLIYSVSAKSSNRGFEGVYTFSIESNQAITFSNTRLFIQYRATFREDRIIVLTYNDIYKQTGSATLSTELNLNTYLPDMKIEEFFSGILKMFNLTCYSNDGINYYVEQLETYYETGSVIDITKYTKSDVIALNRVTNYSKVTFEYQKSESIVNTGFLSANNIEYGTFRYETGYDGGEYSIKLPFENLCFTRFIGTTLQVGLSLKSDLQKYVPKPVIIYDYNSVGLTPANGTFYFATTPISGSASGSPYTSYKAFGQETLVTVGAQSATYSLNFPSQPSTLTNQVVENGLYNQYYSTYLGNIFNKKARLVKVTSILPTSILTKIKLNDRIVLKDKRYIINTMTTNLTNGETQFELLTDIRPVVIPPTPIILPVAVNDAYNITINNLNPINLFPMVNDELGTTPTIITAVNSSITTGTIAITGGGSQLTFTPNGSSGPFIGETFNYTITDSINNISSATVSLNVISTILPVAVNDTYNITLNDLNPIDLFPMVNDTLGVTPTIITAVNSSITTGTITITGFGSQLWFTPNGTSANETFTYTITDNVGSTSTATVSLNVTSTITPPEDDIQPPSLVGSLSTNYAYDTGFTAFWTAATDNVGVTGYNIKLDGLLYDTVSYNTLSYGFDGLQSNTLYTVSVAAFDAAGNIGAYSDANAATTDNGLSPI